MGAAAVAAVGGGDGIVGMGGADFGTEATASGEKGEFKWHYVALQGRKHKEHTLFSLL